MGSLRTSQLGSNSNFGNRCCTWTMRILGLLLQERTGRWVGVTEHIGDQLTYWILDEQSKQLLARSVVRPLHSNRCVKFDPALDQRPKRTASNGGEIWPDHIPKNNCDAKPQHFVTEDSTFTDAGELSCDATKDQYKGPSSLRYFQNPATINPTIDQYPII